MVTCIAFFYLKYSKCFTLLPHSPTGAAAPGATGGSVSHSRFGKQPLYYQSATLLPSMYFLIAPSSGYIVQPQPGLYIKKAYRYIVYNGYCTRYNGMPFFFLTMDLFIYEHYMWYLLHYKAQRSII